MSNPVVIADQVLQEVTSGQFELKHVETQDKSAPRIEEGVTVKKIDRDGFLNEVKSGPSLKHAETVDKSAPVIEEGIQVKKVDRKGLLNEIEAGKELKNVDK
eukprot:TRINITY_DN3818_c0_g1_i1.p1 TRINITY_DN3818_c0_g1~~TRINITY_DN3818_c0_g1_i1.p1  ORF type:complete len:117 (-),score=42.90 TRINITY_DN3818_c0_g1_i1:192-497(-)